LGAKIAKYHYKNFSYLDANALKGYSLFHEIFRCARNDNSLWKNKRQLRAGSLVLHEIPHFANASFGMTIHIRVMGEVEGAAAVNIIKDKVLSAAAPSTSFPLDVRVPVIPSAARNPLQIAVSFN